MAYLSPEPLLQSPVYLRRMAQGGMSVPTYAYGLNNPIRYVDPNGLFLVAGSPVEGSADFSSEDYALINGLIGRIRNDECAAEVVDEVERRSNHVVVQPGRLGRGKRTALGWVHDRSTNGPGIVNLYLDPELISMANDPGGIGDPVGDLLHELIHALFVMDEPSMSEDDQHALIVGRRRGSDAFSGGGSVMQRYRECKKKKAQCQ